MKEKLKQANSYELKTCFVFLWLSGFCSAAFVVSINWHGMEFASFPIGFFFLICMFEAVRWYRLSLRYFYDEDATEAQEESASANEEAQPIEEVATPITTVLPQEELFKRATFYSFVYYVCSQGIIGEGVWEKRGVSSATYKEWMPLLKKMQVVSSPGAGVAPKPLMDFKTALDRIASFSEEEDYWKPVRDSYYPNPNPYSMKVPANTL